MNKLIKSRIFFFIAIIAVISSLALSSCDKPEPETESETGIVGKWVSNSHYYWGPDTYEFQKDGTYTWRCENNKCEGGTYYIFDDKGTYMFNGSVLTLSKYGGSTTVYIVVNISNSSMVIMDEDGDSYTYYRNGN